MIAPFRSGPQSIGEDDLQAYVDGLLDSSRRRAVEAYLAAHPEDVERVEAYRLQNIGLHALFDRPDGRRIPAPVERCRRDLDATLTRHRRCRRGLAGVTATLMVGAVGWWGLGVEQRPGDQGPAVARPAIEVESLDRHDPPRAAEATAGVTQASLVGWLSQRVSGGRPDWPDLRPFGLTLRAERMAVATGGLAVALMYEDSAGRPLALHIDLDGDDLPITAPAVGKDEAALYWRAGPVVLGIISVMEREQLLAVAEAVAEQIAAAGPVPGTRDDDPLLSVHSGPPAEAITQVAGDGAADSGAEVAAEPTSGVSEAIEPTETDPAAEQAPVEHEPGAHSGSHPEPLSDLVPSRPTRPPQHGSEIIRNAGNSFARA